MSIIGSFTTPPRAFELTASRAVRRMLAAFIVLLGFAWPSITAAQINGYSNTTTGTIDGSTTCAAPLVRNFTVATSFTVADVDLGFLATHSWRGDIRLTLQSRAGTRRQLVNGDVNLGVDNLNVSSPTKRRVTSTSRRTTLPIRPPRRLIRTPSGPTRR